MNYEEFKQAFKAEMMVQVGGPDMVVHEEQTARVNQTMDALIIAPAGSRIAAQIYLNDLYKEYEGGRSLISLVRESVDNLESSLRHMPEAPELSHDFLEKNLYLSVMNPEMNQVYLKDVPYEYLEDMAVVPRVRVNDEASFAVKDWMLGQYGFSREGLFQAARANMDRQEYQCMSLTSMIGGMGFADTEPGPADSVYVLTNMTTIDGAAAILSERAMKQAREVVGEDFFILPSSRHEVILVPRSSSLTVAEMTDMVVMANRTVVEDKDLLSDHVYRYNSSSGKIKMLEPVEQAKKLDRVLSPVL
jgi:hypothetical protein